MMILLLSYCALVAVLLIAVGFSVEMRQLHDRHLPGSRAGGK